jgi:hypothetical protein
MDFVMIGTEALYWATGPFPADGYYIVRGLLDESIGGDERAVYVHADCFTWGFDESDDPEAIDLDSGITPNNIMWRRPA